MASEQPNLRSRAPHGLVVETTGLGRIGRLCRALRASSEPVVIWIDSDWLVDATPLSDALSQAPDLDFVWGVAGSEDRSSVDADRLWMTPTLIPALALRPESLARAEQPDFGAPDAVLDAAAGWVIATSLVLRGCHGRAVALPAANAMRNAPEAIDRLTPVGIAWLISQAQGWVESASEPSRSVSVVTARGSAEAAR